MKSLKWWAKWSRLHIFFFYSTVFFFRRGLQMFFKSLSLWLVSIADINRLKDCSQPEVRWRAICFDYDPESLQSLACLFIVRLRLLSLSRLLLFLLLLSFFFFSSSCVVWSVLAFFFYLILCFFFFVVILFNFYFTTCLFLAFKLPDKHEGARANKLTIEMQTICCAHRKWMLFWLPRLTGSDATKSNQIKVVRPYQINTQLANHNHHNK